MTERTGLEILEEILDRLDLLEKKIDIVDPNYFVDPWLRVIAAAIKEAKKAYDMVPDMGSLEFRLLEEISDVTQRKYVLDVLSKIKESNINDTLYVQDIAMKFCNQQEELGIYCYRYNLQQIFPASGQVRITANSNGRKID